MRADRPASRAALTLLAALALAACRCAGSPAGVAAPERTDLPPLELPVVEPRVVIRNPIAVADPARHDLAPFFDALNAIERGQPAATATVLHIGDSHVASDTISGEIRDLMQSRFGDGGRGYAQPQGVSRWHRQESMTVGGTGSWLVEHAMQRAEPIAPIGLSGVRVTADEPDVTLTRGACTDCRFGASFDRVLVHYLQAPEAGSFEILVDGEASRVVPTDGDEPMLGVAALDLIEGPHEVTIRALGDGPVHVLGVATERSVGGARYESFGLNGARASHWRNLDPTLVADEVRARGADLLVVAFGTNEAYGDRFRYGLAQDATPEEMQERFESLLQAIHNYADELEILLRTMLAGAPEASCLVLLPPDFHDRDAPCMNSPEEGEEICIRHAPESLSRVVAAQRRAAEAVGCAVWDQQAAMGGQGGMSMWQLAGLGRDDGIHLSMSGYDVMAEGLYRDMMRAYERYKLGGEPTLSTSRIVIDDELEQELIGRTDAGDGVARPVVFEPAR